jgi:hypothetical protein
MGVAGRNRDTMRAVEPVRVTVTMAAALRSWAVVQVAWDSALIDALVQPRLRRVEKALVIDDSSVRSAIFAIVRMVSTGYLPLAVSPESISALVPS